MIFSDSVQYTIGITLICLGLFLAAITLFVYCIRPAWSRKGTLDVESVSGQPPKSGKGDQDQLGSVKASNNTLPDTMLENEKAAKSTSQETISYQPSNAIKMVQNRTSQRDSMIKSNADHQQSFSTSENDRKIGLVSSATLRITKTDRALDGDIENGRNSPRSSVTGSRSSLAVRSSEILAVEDGKLTKLTKKIRSNSYLAAQDKAGSTGGLHRVSSRELVSGSSGTHHTDASSKLSRSASFSLKAEAEGGDNSSSPKSLRKVLSHNKLSGSVGIESQSSPRNSQTISSHATGFSPDALALALEYTTIEVAASTLLNLKKPIQAAQTLNVMSESRALSVLQAMEPTEQRLTIKSLWDQVRKEEE